MNLLQFAMALFLAIGLWSVSPQAAELIMVEQDGCHWCARWNAEIAPAYPNTDEGRRAPLRRVNLHDLPGDISFASKPVFTPTFVLVEDGEELGRMEGYAGDQFFWFLLDKLLDTYPTEPHVDE